jgi:hypothetical protein
VVSFDERIMQQRGWLLLCVLACACQFDPSGAALDYPEQTGGSDSGASAFDPADPADLSDPGEPSEPGEPPVVADDYCDRNDESLVACYTFDNQDTGDGTGLGNDLDPIGPIAFVPGKIGMAVAPEPDSALVATGNPSLDPRDGLTLEMWIWREGVVRSDTRVGLIDYGATYGLFLTGGGDDATDDDTEDLSSAKLTCAPHGQVLTGTIDVRRRAWTHIACIDDGKVLTLWHNGQLVVSRPSKGSYQPGDGPLTIATDRNYSATFPGFVDQVRIFHAAKAPDQPCSGRGCP